MVSHASKCFLVTNHILWCQDENLCHQKVLFCSYNSLKLSILISSLSSNKQWRRQQGCWECQGTPGIWAFRKGTKPDFCLSGVQLSLKVAFFHKVQSVFSNLQTSKMKISQKTILSLKLDIYFGIFFFEIWRSENRIALSEKKPPLPKFPLIWFLAYVNGEIFTLVKLIEQSH